MEKQIKEIIRSVVREGFISELSKNDIHVKEIMKFYDKGTYSTKKAVSIFVSGKTNATRNQILDDLGDMGYNDAWEVMDHFKLKIESVNEVITYPKRTNPNDLAKTALSFYDFYTDYIDDGGRRRSTMKRNNDVVDWFGSHPNEIKEKAYKIMLSQYKGDNSKIKNTFGKYIKESVNEEKVYIDYLNKKKGFKQDRIKFNSYEDAVKWARKNFEKFSPDMIKYESVNENTLNEGFGDSIKKIRNLAIKMASTKYDRAKSHLNLDKIASADDFDGKDTMNKATAALLQQNDLDEDLKATINKIAVKLGTGATMMGIITALVSMSGWIQYLNSTFTRWYYTEIQKLAEPEVMKVMQDLAKAGQAEGSIWVKFGMYAFFIFFTIAVISLVAARMTQKPKKEYVDKKGVERVAAALPQTEEEPIKECKTC
jgi:hypothetical protein